MESKTFMFIAPKINYMHRNLLKDTKQILESAYELTGIPVELKEEQSLQYRAEIIMRKNAEKYILKYHPKYEPELNYLIAHEVGHILRFWQATNEERKLPISSEKTRKNAIEQLSQELIDMENKGFPLNLIFELFDLMYLGLVRQVTSMPIDVRIEEWIYTEFPRLRLDQEMSLRNQIFEAHHALSKEIENLTPKLIYHANNAMNYVFSYFISSLYDDSKLVEPYIGSCFQSDGKKLIGHLYNEEDKGYKGDRKIINKWAQQLNIQNWFEWLDFQRIECFSVG